MSQALLVRKQSPALAEFSELLRRVRETLLRAQQEIEEVKIRSGWEIGRDINEHIKIHGGRAKYGEKILSKLSKQLGVSHDQFDRFARFAEKFPDWDAIDAMSRKSAGNPLQTSKNASNAGLFLSHFFALLPVEEDKVRWRLARQAFHRGWTVEKLEEKVREIKMLPHPGPLPKGEGRVRGDSRNTQSARRTTDLIKPRIGKLHTYRVLDPEEAGWPSNRVGFGARPDRGRLLLDHGFRHYHELEEAASRKLKAGDIVEIVGARSPRPGRGDPAPTQEIIPSTRTEKDRYFYRAYAVKAIDGDTFWAAIDAGLSVVGKQKLRLRGVDAKEINTPQGRRAYRFVKSILPPGLAILIRTSASPTFDRFEADVFVPVNELTRGIVEKTQPKGIESKIEMIDAGEGSPRPYYFLNNLLLERRLAVRVKK